MPVAEGHGEGPDPGYLVERDELEPAEAVISPSSITLFVSEGLGLGSLACSR